MGLRDRLSDYRRTLHCRTAIQTTTCKVDGALKKIKAEDLQHFQEADVAKGAIKLNSQQSSKPNKEGVHTGQRLLVGNYTL